MDYDKFIEEQHKIIDDAHNQVVANIKEIHNKGCKNPTSKCEEEFIFMFLLIVAQERTDKIKIFRDITRRVN